MAGATGDSFWFASSKREIRGSCGETVENNDQRSSARSAFPQESRTAILSTPSGSELDRCGKFLLTRWLQLAVPTAPDFAHQKIYFCSKAW